MRQLNGLRSYFSGDRKIELLVVTLACLVVADGILTEFLVTRGLGFEANPFLAIWISNDSFLIIKLVGGVLAALMLWDLHRRHFKTTFLVSLCLVIAYTVIVFWNLFSLLLTLA